MKKVKKKYLMVPMECARTYFFFFFGLEYHTILSYLEINKVDLVLCDFIMNVCVDAATTLNIPYIITAAMDTTTGERRKY